MITPHTIEEVRGRVDIYDAVSRTVQLKKAGSAWEACCPFHTEKTPSFRVNPARGKYKCFGCGEGGDAIAFVMKSENKTFTEAVEALAEMARVEVTYTGNLSKEEIAQRKASERERMTILQFAQDWYHERLLADANPALEALQTRGVALATIERWKLGFAPENWHNLSYTFAEKGQQAAAAEVGLLNTSKTPAYDVYMNRIMIPMRDERGVLIGFTGRALNQEAKAKYLNPKESETYKKSEQVFALFEAKQAIRETGIAYLVEGHFDAISMHAAGVENTVATGGTALTPEQVSKIKKAGAGHIVLMYDGDEAGERAMDKAIDLCLKQDLRVEIILLPEGQDPDSLVRGWLAEEPVPA